MKHLAGKAVKKPTEIDFFIWQGFSKAHANELIQWVQSFKVDFVEYFELDVEGGTLRVNTLEGSSYGVPRGYVIIRGVKGEFYPCDPEIFNETYTIL